MLAMAMQAPEMALSPAESDALAKSVANVGKYYVKIDGGNRLAAWGALLFTIGVIYLPRMMAISRRKAVQPPSRPEAPSETRS